MNCRLNDKIIDFHFHSTFNFSVPELSWLAVFLLFLACLVLHFIPIRILLILWGCTKFSRRLIRPHSVPNNEVLDLLSRVPDDEQMVSSTFSYSLFAGSDTDHFHTNPLILTFAGNV